MQVVHDLLLLQLTSAYLHRKHKKGIQLMLDAFCTVNLERNMAKLSVVDEIK